MKIEKNSIHKLKIDGYSSDGDGIGRIDGIACFVKGALVGETVQVKIIKVAKNCMWAKLQNVIEASESRIKADCKHSMACGGCSLRHMNYNEELKFKLQRINDAFARIAKIDFKIDEIVGGNTDRYRNKATFPVSSDKNDNVKIGIYQARSHNVIDVDTCKIQSTQAEKIISIFRKWMNDYDIPAYDEVKQTGCIRHIFVRTNKNGEVLVCVVSRTEKINKIEKLIELLKNSSLDIVGIVLNINSKNTNVIMGSKYITLFGQNFIFDEVCGIKYKLDVASFFQVNRAQAEILYNTAIDFAKIQKDDVVADIYCGVGSISLIAAKHAKCVTGVEIVPQAIENAKHNAKINNIKNVEFICSSAEDASVKFIEQNFKPNIIFVDPPRKGLDKTTLSSIIKMEPSKIVYVSCDPATLARDLHIFYENNYNIKRAKAVDMFPRTPHIETVCLLTHN